jgi:transposase
MDAILLVLRTGMQWNALDSTGICSGSAAYRRFRDWVEAGVFATCWRLGLLEDDELEGIDWDWRALGSAMTKASLGSWLNRFRRLLVRCEERDDTYLAMRHFACGLITWRSALSK